MPRDGRRQRVVAAPRKVDGSGAIVHRLHARRVEGQDRKRDPVRVHLAQPLALHIQQPAFEHVQLPRHRVLGGLTQRVRDSEVLFDGDFVLQRPFPPPAPPALPAYVLTTAAAKSLRSSAYSRLSTRACRLASMMFSSTPIVVQVEMPSPLSMSTRVRAAVPD